MIARSDIRFQSSGADALAAPGFALPVHLVIDRPTADAALAEARRLADLLRADLSGAEPTSGRLELVDPATRSALSVEHRSRSEVRLNLTVWLSLTPPPGSDFWVRAVAIGRATDFAQRFAQRAHGKGVEADAGRAEPEVAPPTPAGQSEVN